jgi:hypothetical protein
MKLRLCTYSLAILACAALLPIPATLAQVAGSDSNPGCQDPPRWSQDRLAKFNVALATVEQDVAKRESPARQEIHWSRDQLSDFDAAIASLQQDLATRQGNVRGKAEAVLNELRDRRDGYRVEIREAAANSTVGTQAGDDKAANAFWNDVDAYLDAVHADVATRQAAMQTRFMGN